MANKLSWTELRRSLASRAGVSEKEANIFLTALNAQIVEALKQDKQVKINGLGTFRLQTVAPRKSVDITTGEEITIDSYNKIAFSPEAGVKELVEKISTSTESSTPLSVASDSIDPLQKLGEQAAEIVDILADLGQSPQPAEEEPMVEEPMVEEPVVEEPVVEEPMVEEPVVEEPVEEEPVVEEPMVEEPMVEEPMVEEPKIEVPVVEIPKMTEPIVKEPIKEDFVTSVPEKKKGHCLRNFIIFIIIIAVLLGIGYFFFKPQMTTWIEIAHQKYSSVTTLVSKYIGKSDVLCDTTSIASIDTIMSVSIEDQKSEQSTFIPQEIVYNKFITTEPMREASRLAWMSKRYYGDKKFWPYLYDANKDHIVNPNDIEVGTPIRVPDLTEEQLDTTLESTRLTLEYLLRQAEAASKQ